MCPNCRAFVTTRDRVCPYCEAELSARRVVREPGAILGGLIPQARFVTIVILTLNFGLFAATLVYSLRAGASSPMDIDGRTLFQFGAKYRDAILHGQWWRLVTAGFLHGGFFHIMMNSWVLFDLGAQVEEVYGTRRLVVIYFISTVIGFLASTWWSPALSVGASAGVFGLIGAMIAFGVTRGGALGGAVKALYVRWAVYGLLMGLLPFFQIDNAAHLGGLAGGFACGYATGEPRAGAMSEKVWAAAAAMALLLTAYSFVRMFLWFSVAV